MLFTSYKLAFNYKWELVTFVILIILTIFVAHSLHFKTAKAANVNHIVISEIQISGETATDEFVELYNPTNSAINIEGWRLTRKTSSGAESNLVSSLTGTIPSNGYYLIAHPDYDGATQTDITYSASSNSITANNTVLLYSDASLTLIDKVGMGEATDHEGSQTITPDSGISIERKASSASNSETMNIGGTDEFNGNGEDTNSNESDFVVRSIPQPQNTNSPAEISQTINPSPTLTSMPTEVPPTSPSPTTQPMASPTPTYIPDTIQVVISEIQFSGNTVDDEFVELYNPTDASIDLADWRLRRKTATGASETNIVSSITGSIPAHGYFLIAPSEYEGSIPADQIYSTSTRLTANNIVYLYKLTDDTYELVDKVGTGEADDYETTATTSPETGTSIERKASATSTPESMASGGNEETSGNAYDTNNNFADFVTRTMPQPQNTNSPTEQPSGTSPTPSPILTATPSPTTSPSPTNEPTGTPTASPTPTLVPSPTAIPTPTPGINIPPDYSFEFTPIRLTCHVTYHPIRFGRWFTLYFPRIHCSHANI